MAEIEITDKELFRVKHKRGVYSNLRNKSVPQQDIKLAEKVFESLPFVSKLRKDLYKTMERAFREYARRHGCPKDMENTEWQRFSKILEKYL